MLQVNNACWSSLTARHISQQIFCSGRELGVCERAASCFPSISYTCSIGFKLESSQAATCAGCFPFQGSRQSHTYGDKAYYHPWIWSEDRQHLETSEYKAQEFRLCIFGHSQTPCQRNMMPAHTITPLDGKWCLYITFLGRNVFHVLSIALPNENHYPDWIGTRH